MTIIEEIKKNYTKAGHPIAFSSPGNIQRYYRGKGESYKHADILETIKSLDSYTLHREYHKPPLRNPYFPSFPRQQLQMDLIDASKLKDDNDNITFLLILIDNFTKKVWARGLLQKSAVHTRDALRSIIESMAGEKVRLILSDRGKEFKNLLVKQYLESQKIELRHPHGELKCAIVERANGSIEQLLYRLMEHRQSYRYIDHLDLIIETYNSRGHRSLDFMSPNQAELPENRDFVFNAHNKRVSKIVAKRKAPKYAVDDVVIVKNLPGRFDRGYHRRFNTEKFKIFYVDTRRPIPMYSLESLNDGEKIKGAFYAQELQPVRNDGVYRITVLKRKRVRGKLKLFVHFEGYDETHRQWIDAETDLVQN